MTRLCLDRQAKKRPQYMAIFRQCRDSSRGPETLVIDAELRDAVQRCLAKLPANQRIAIILRHTNGMSYDEIAAVSSCRQRRSIPSCSAPGASPRLPRGCLSL